MTSEVIAGPRAWLHSVALLNQEILMSSRLLILIGVFASFSVLTGLALMEVGYFGILEPLFKSWGAGQVLADLVIACLLACIWMVKDAKQRGVSAWPFIAITLVLGSFGPLLYLLAREWSLSSRVPTSA